MRFECSVLLFILDIKQFELLLFMIGLIFCIEEKLINKTMAFEIFIKI